MEGKHFLKATALVGSLGVGAYALESAPNTKTNLPKLVEYQNSAPHYTIPCGDTHPFACLDTWRAEHPQEKISRIGKGEDRNLFIWIE